MRFSRKKVIIKLTRQDEVFIICHLHSDKKFSGVQSLQKYQERSRHIAINYHKISLLIMSMSENVQPSNFNGIFTLKVIHLLKERISLLKTF